MGKWSEFKEKFGSHRGAVHELKTEFFEQASGKKKDLAKLLRGFHERKEELEEETKEIGAKIEAVSELLVEMMEDAEEDKLSYTDIGGFKMSDNIYVNVFDEDLLHRYLKRHRQGALIQPKVHHKRLESHVKALLSTKGSDFEPEKAGLKLHVKSKVVPEKLKDTKNE